MQTQIAIPEQNSGTGWQPSTRACRMPVLGLLTVLVLELVFSIRQQSQTFDEGFHLQGASAVSHIARADAVRNTDPEQALAEAREGVGLTPNSVRARLVLGRALAKTGHPEEAHAELGKALALALIEPAWYPIQIADARRELRSIENGRTGGAP